MTNRAEYRSYTARKRPNRRIPCKRNRLLRIGHANRESQAVRSEKREGSKECKRERVFLFGILPNIGLGYTPASSLRA
jgi:hypothetical protein